MRFYLLPASLLMVLGLGGCSRQPQAQTQRATGPVEVRVAPVTSRQIQRIVEAVGTLFPFDEVVVSAEIEGPVNRVEVDLGDAVQEGQVLARISEEEQRYLVAQTEAQMRQALERLGLANENEKVRDIRQTPEVRRAQAELSDAEQRFKRVRDLVDHGVGSRQDLDQAEARFKALAAGYDSTMVQTRNLIQDVERLRAVLDLQRKKLRDATVRAPFAALVKERQVTVGQYVRPNTPLFALVKTDPIRLRAEIPERMAPWVRAGQTADVVVEAYENRVFKGKIWRISPTVDPSKRTFVIEALVQNPAGELKPGSYARARVETSRFDEVKLVPARAVNYVLGSNKVYVVQGQQVEAREVRIGDRFDQDVEILDGVKEGEQVATTQVARLDTGSKVRVAGN